MQTIELLLGNLDKACPISHRDVVLCPLYNKDRWPRNATPHHLADQFHQRLPVFLADGVRGDKLLPG